jgi:hypothetical protein
VEILAVVAMITFGVGLVLAAQAVIGKEISSEGAAFSRHTLDAQGPGISHPPDKHRLRLFLIGLGADGGVRRLARRVRRVAPAS